MVSTSFLSSGNLKGIIKVAKTTPTKQVRIDEVIYKDIEIIAKDQHRSVTSLVNHVLAQMVNAAKVGLDRSEL